MPRESIPQSRERKIRRPNPNLASTTLSVNKKSQIAGPLAIEKLKNINLAKETMNNTSKRRSVIKTWRCPKNARSRIINHTINNPTIRALWVRVKEYLIKANQIIDLKIK